MRWINSTAVRQRSKSRSWSVCEFFSGFAGSLAKLDDIKWLPDTSLSGGSFGLLEVLASYAVQVRGCSGRADGLRLSTGQIHALRTVRRSSVTFRAKKAISAAKDFMATPRVFATQRPRSAGLRCDACHINDGPYGARSTNYQLNGTNLQSMPRAPAPANTAQIGLVVVPAHLS